MKAREAIGLVVVLVFFLWAAVWNTTHVRGYPLYDTSAEFWRLVGLGLVSISVVVLVSIAVTQRRDGPEAAETPAVVLVAALFATAGMAGFWLLLVNHPPALEGVRHLHELVGALVGVVVLVAYVLSRARDRLAYWF